MQLFTERHSLALWNYHCCFLVSSSVSLGLFSWLCGKGLWISVWIMWHQTFPLEHLERVTFFEKVHLPCDTSISQSQATTMFSVLTSVNSFICCSLTCLLSSYTYFLLSSALILFFTITLSNQLVLRQNYVISHQQLFDRRDYAIFIFTFTAHLCLAKVKHTVFWQ